VCKTGNPPAIDVEPGHSVKCWLYQTKERGE